MPHALVAVAAWVGQTAFQIASAAGASITAAATVAQVAVAATYVAEVAAAVALSKALQPKIGGTYGSQVDFKADPQAGLPYAVGRTGVAGNLVFRQTAGAKNSYLNDVAVYTCAGPIDSYESFSVNGTAITFGTDSGEGASGYYQNRMWRRSQLGASPESGYLHWTSTGTKDTPADHSGLPSEWTSTHKLSGLAADLWGLQYNTDKYSAGVPQRITVAKWVKAYDPRLDGTYPGGSGPHRSNDETTWAWTANPYLHAIAWLLGRFQNGKRIIACGLAVAMIDMAAFVEGANVADANGWTCGGVCYSTDDKWEVLKAFLQAGGGKPMRLGAKVSCLVNTPRTSLATITKADVVGEVTIAGSTPRRARINTIWPKYREEAQAWQMVTPDSPVSVASYVTEDGNTVRSRILEYPLVQDVDQAAQLAYYDIADGREFTPVVLPCKPIWMGYRPGDCITATEPEWGLNGQKLLILRRRRDPVTMTVTLICRSETDAKHAAALGKSGVAPSTPGLTAFDPNTLAAPGAAAFASSGTTVTSSVGAIPILLVTGKSDNGFATKVVVRYRKNGATDWTFWPDTPVFAVDDDVRIEIPAVSGQLYNVEVAYRSARDTLGAWRALSNATAGSFTLATYDAAITDGILTPAEKSTFVPGIKAILAASTNLLAQAALLSLPSGGGTPTSNFTNAVSNWNSYASGLTSPVAWDNFTGNTTISAPSTMRTRVQDLINTQTELQTAVGNKFKGRTQHIDDNGRLTTVESLPGINVPVGFGFTFSSYPFTSDGTHIFVASTTLKAESYSRTLPSATISSLTNSSIYGMVFQWPGDFWAVCDPLFEDAFIASVDLWLFAGEFSTTNGAGVYPTPIEPSGATVGYRPGHFNTNQP